MSKDSLQLVSRSVNPCQGVCEVEHDCAILKMAAEISFIADVGGPLSPPKEGFFLWVNDKSVVVFSRSLQHIPRLNPFIELMYPPFCLARRVVMP